MRGRWIALSSPRRLLTDLSHLSRAFPRATLLTRINVAALVEPRDQARIQQVPASALKRRARPGGARLGAAAVPRDERSQG
jgi:hypothetical protein